VIARADALTRLASRAGVRGALVPVDGSGREAERAAGHAAASAVGAAVTGYAADGQRPVHADGRAASIAHTATEAVAVAADAGCVRALGVDVEHAGALAVEDARLVLGADEQAYVDGHDRPEWAATLLWSAKESAFKAWSHATDGGLGTVDPVDIRVVVDADARSFTVTADGRLGEIVCDLVPSNGYFDDADGRVFTLVVLPRRASG
jgi:phosphopantetheinyl transferase (holo-ACP synthase)